LPEQANQNLRRSLVELRQALGAEASRLVNQAERKLSLNLTGAWVDIVAFDKAAKANDVVTLEAAVALYRGELMSGQTDRWVEEEREKYKQAYHGTLLKLSDATKSYRSVSAAIPWLRLMVKSDPVAESGHRALMQALADNGEISAALLVYQELRQHLWRICHREPDPATTALFIELRDRAPQEPPLKTPAKPVQTVGVPHPLTPIIGRQIEIHDIRDRLRKARLVTLTGGGGVGKTRLAIQVGHEVAREYADGVWFIDLASLTTPL